MKIISTISGHLIKCMHIFVIEHQMFLNSFIRKVRFPWFLRMFFGLELRYQKNVGGVAFSLVGSILDPMVGSMSNLIS